MDCKICRSEVSKYKCPYCLIAYCGVDCWKKHKTEDCNPVLVAEKTDDGENSSRYEYQTEDTVPIDRLKLLEGSETLRHILKNPQLRDLLVSVDSSPNPERAMQLAMQESLFVEFADECLKIVEPVEDSL